LVLVLIFKDILKPMKFKLLIFFSLIAIVAFAQQSEIVTDRPFQTQSSAIAPSKTFQLETGFSYAHSMAGRVESEYISYNSSLLRIGLLDNLELRFGMAYNSSQVKSDIKPVAIVGWTPMVVGGKVFIAKEKGWRPEIAVLGHLTLPFLGNEAYRPERVAPDFRLAFSHSLGSRFSLSYNLGLEWPMNKEEDVLGVYSILLSYKIMDRFSCFVENYGFLDTEYAVDGGFTYLLNNNFQIDLYGGFGLNPDSPDQFIGAGFSWRIPR
jgi:hypothetical protein